MTIDEIIKLASEAASGMLSYDAEGNWRLGEKEVERFATLIRNKALEEAARVTGEFAQKWWSIHCASNKHMETTRKAHDDFCALQAAIRAKNEASRRNSAYDVFGMDNTPENTHPLETAAAAELRRLHARSEADEALMQQALEWIEAQPEPRMIGAAKIITALKERLK